MNRDAKIKGDSDNIRVNIGIRNDPNYKTHTVYSNWGKKTVYHSQPVTEHSVFDENIEYFRIYNDKEIDYIGKYTGYERYKLEDSPGKYVYVYEYKFSKGSSIMSSNKPPTLVYHIVSGGGRKTRRSRRKSVHRRRKNTIRRRRY
jgi:hypothetical protein